MKGAFRNAAVNALRGGLAISGERGRRIAAEALCQGGEPLYEEIETVATPRGSIAFYCLGDTARWRARELMTKEPETIEWIDHFSDGDVFWDVGANIGVYALYAAIRHSIRVFAFEPSAANYYLLNRNIELNRLDANVRAYCVAFSDRNAADALNMVATGFGKALSSFGVPVDPFGKQFEPRFKQGMIGFSIDDFVARFNPPFPNHLKIDVDGIEDRIIEGATATLADRRVRSLSIELDEARPDYTGSIIGRIRAAGLMLTTKRHAEMFEGGPYQSIYNYQFHRKAP